MASSTLTARRRSTPARRLEADDDPVAVFQFSVGLRCVVDVLVGAHPRMFQETGFHRAAPYVVVDGERRRLVALIGMSFSRRRRSSPPGPGVVADRCQHLEIRCQRGGPTPRSAPGRCPCRCSRGRRCHRCQWAASTRVLDDQRPAPAQTPADSGPCTGIGWIMRAGEVLLGELVAGVDHGPTGSGSPGHAGAPTPYPAALTEV